MTTRTIGMAAAVSLLLLTASGTAVTASATPGAPDVKKYIVQTRSPDTATAVASKANNGGGMVENLYSKALTGFAATMTATQVRGLKSDSRVQSSTLDGVVHCTGTQTNPAWGLDRIDQRSTA